MLIWDLLAVKSDPRSALLLRAAYPMLFFSFSFLFFLLLCILDFISVHYEPRPLLQFGCGYNYNELCAGLVKLLLNCVKSANDDSQVNIQAFCVQKKPQPALSELLGMASPPLHMSFFYFYSLFCVPWCI